jgi:hypothetical protein
VTYAYCSGLINIEEFADQKFMLITIKAIMEKLAKGFP